MTEFAFLKLLGELPEAYIQEAHAAPVERASKQTEVRKKAGPLVATAAVAALLAGSALWAMPHWQRESSSTEKTTYMEATLASEPTGETTAAIPMEYPVLDDWAQNVLKNATRFENKTYEETLNLEEYIQRYQKLTKEEKCSYSLFTWQDLDDDGQMELAVNFTRKGNLELTLVLAEREEKIVSQEIWAGGMQFLQRDGSYVSFYANTWHHLERNEQGWSIQELPDHPSVWDMERDTAPWYSVEDYLLIQENQ